MNAWLLALGLAAAADPCDRELTPPPPTQSVAWISPLRKQVAGGRWLEVVPTRQLTAWLAEHPDASTGDLLRHVGQRKRKGDPARRFKVVIFEASSGALCRPIEGVEEGEPVSGLPACPSGQSRATRKYEGCGVATDHATDGPGPEVYRGQWRELAARGFCLLPAERFLAEGAR